VRVLGIDPGSRVTGWGLVEAAPRGPRRLAAGVATPGAGDAARRLGDLATCLERLLDEWQPAAVAMERAFVGRNAASALKLGEVRGALLAVAGRRGIDVVDYPPATVKIAVTGSGRAEKEQVARGVRMLLGGGYAAGDATDALAVAICHVLHAAAARRLDVPAGAARAEGRRWVVRRA
jgi:crossover junction endodeoxyribonuclease RuvC